MHNQKRFKPSALNSLSSDFGDDPWCSRDPMFINMMKQVDKFRELSLKEKAIERVRAVLSAELRSLENSGVRDEVCCELEFKVRGEPLRLYSFGVNLCVDPDPETGTGTMRGDSIQWALSQNGKLVSGVETIWLPSISKKKNPKTKRHDLVRRVVLLFTPPLPVSKTPYHLATVYSVKEFLPHIGRKNEDFCSFTASQGRIRHVEVSVSLPVSVANAYGCYRQASAEEPDSRKLAEAKSNLKPRAGLVTFTVTGKNLKPGDNLSIKVRRH